MDTDKLREIHEIDRTWAVARSLKDRIEKIAATGLDIPLNRILARTCIRVVLEELDHRDQDIENIYNDSPDTYQRIPLGQRLPMPLGGLSDKKHIKCRK